MQVRACSLGGHGQAGADHRSRHRAATRVKDSKKRPSLLPYQVRKLFARVLQRSSEAVVAAFADCPAARAKDGRADCRAQLRSSHQLSIPHRSAALPRCIA